MSGADRGGHPDHFTHHARRALQEGVKEDESRLMAVYALRVLGDPGGALDLLMHVPYEFYQPYLKLLEQGPLLPGSSATASGIMMAITMGSEAIG